MFEISCSSYLICCFNWMGKWWEDWGQKMLWAKQLRASRVPEIIPPWFRCWARGRVYLQGWLSLPCSVFSNLPEAESYHCCTELDTWGELNWAWKGCKDCTTKERLAARVVSFPPHAALYHGQGCRGGWAVQVGSSAPSIPLLQKFCRQDSYGSMLGKGM